MRLSTNEPLIQRQSKIARYAMLGGLAILLASFITNITGNFPVFDPQVAAYIMLFVGFTISYIGAILSNKWIKEPRADVALAKALKGFDNKHHLYNWLLPASHVLLAPTGLVVFRVKSNDGKIVCNGDKWKSPFRASRLIGGMGQEGLGNPTSDVRVDIDRVKGLIADRVENAGLVPVDGYVVFTSPKADLDIQECSVPAVRVDDLKDVMRKGKRGAPLSAKLYQDLSTALDEIANAKTA